MKDTVLKISLAALFHDIGKFAQEALALPAGYQENNADLYQPFRDGHHTHAHALYTAAFIEKYKSILPEELNARDWGEGERVDSFINLAAKHHKPETALQFIITQADRLSSGFDRAEFQKGEEIGIREYRQTRLLPIFERLLRQDKKFDKPEDFEYRYPLAPVSAKNIFPVKSKDPKKQEAKEEYRRLFENFEKDLTSLCHRKHVELWAQHFDSLLRIYASHIPAARVGKVIHDVSLYDHLRTTAALAGALYLYHRETESFNEKAISDDTPKKFLLVSGDFYGIQHFIFRGGGEERHHRAKLLRGRSFLVSLLMELAAEMLCEKIGLSFLSVFFSAAGKFHLLAPNTENAKKAIGEVREEINRWLYENFFGECAIGFAV
ncbi:type III-A CRISPR-associated protein Cas10/Csm1, partial [Thermodesulfatator atlanticus]